jgi:hypothetical protein
MRDLARRLQPAVLCFSLLLLMLGVTFALVTGLALWLRAPEQVYLHQLTPDKVLVLGGESVAAALSHLKGELGIAFSLLIVGVTGVLCSRPERISPSP